MSEIFGNYTMIIIKCMVDAYRELRDVVSRDSPEIDYVNNSWTHSDCICHLNILYEEIHLQII